MRKAKEGRTQSGHFLLFSQKFVLSREALLREAPYSDVIFNVQGREIPAHKCVLFCGGDDVLLWAGSTGYPETWVGGFPFSGQILVSSGSIFFLRSVVVHGGQSFGC